MKNDKHTTNSKSTPQAKVEKIFEGTKIRYFHAYPEKQRVHFEIGGEALTFVQAHALAKLFGTESITFGANHTGGGCSSCGFGDDDYYSVEVNGATRGL